MAAKLTKEACRAARALLGLTTHELAAKLGVSPTTLNGVEAGNPIRESTERKIVEGLAALGVEITNGDGTGARIKFICPEMRVLGKKVGGGFSVMVTWPAGQVEHIGGFETEGEADQWIATEGAAWVAVNPMARPG